MKELTEEEFQATFSPPMSDVTSTADEVVSIWPYIELVLADDFADFDTSEWDVEHVYMNATGSYQHVLIDTGMENVYLILVVDVRAKAIHGHHLLNLNQKYSLTN